MTNSSSSITGSAGVSHAGKGNGAGETPALPVRATIAILFLLTSSISWAAGEATPTSSDPALTITKFAGSDLIKQPTGITFTADGKLLAIQSNTHFRPDDYDGAETDQVFWLQDTDGDGVADQRSVFFETDLVATMDIATHPETGAIYVATRNEVLRLWDRDGDGKADPDSVERRLVFLETTADYPHNGVSGLCFDDDGDLFFGIGENYGADYTLRGSDGSSVSDGGEGGNIWHVTRDGGELRRYATGFWNPFGVCHAPGGHVFATDNDPSSRPPSRLHYVIDGGDYGYQYRYGRSGQHPFISWNGELPGTLPMLHAAGEAPCDVIFFRGHLLVASWADHRIGLYPLTWDKTHFTTEREILVQGGSEFRPVAFAFGPDGALYVSDWVKKDYQLHGEGAVWRIEGWEPEELPMPPKFTAPPITEENLLAALTTEDPWLLSRNLSQRAKATDNLLLPPEQVANRTKFWHSDLLIQRRKDPTDQFGFLDDPLKSSDPTLRLLALKWICDEKLEKYRAEVEAIAADPASPTLFHAAITTLARLDGQPVDDKPIQRLIGARLQASDASPSVRRAAFQVLANREKFLSIRDLKALYEDPESDDEFRIEVLLTLLVHADEKPAKQFAEKQLTNEKLSDAVRPFAEEVARRGEPRPAPAENGIAGRPTGFDFDAWSDFLSEPQAPSPTLQASPGRLAFHRHCAACHSALGFGRQGGPDLSNIGQRGRDHILRSILDPSAEVAPQYEAWQLNLADGTQKMGFMLGQRGGNHFYGDAAGNQFEIYNRDIVTRQQVPVSLMPPGLVMTMTNDEIRDLVSWLTALR